MVEFGESPTKASILLTSSGSLTSKIDDPATWDVERTPTTIGIRSGAVLRVADRAHEVFASRGVEDVSDRKTTCCCILFSLVPFSVFFT